jgi:hypothetical protein
LILAFGLQIENNKGQLSGWRSGFKSKIQIVNRNSERIPRQLAAGLASE